MDATKGILFFYCYTFLSELDKDYGIAWQNYCVKHIETSPFAYFSSKK